MNYLFLILSIFSIDLTFIETEIIKALNSPEILKTLSIFEQIKSFGYKTTGVSSNTRLRRFLSNTPESILLNSQFKIGNKIENLCLESDTTYHTSTTTVAPFLAKYHSVFIGAIEDPYFSIKSHTLPFEITYHNLGYRKTDTSYIKYISNSITTSSKHDAIFKNNSEKIAELTSGRYTNFISIQFHNDIDSILKNVVFSFIFDYDENKYYLFTDLDARIIWNLVIKETNLEVPETGISKVHIEKLKNHILKQYYPNCEEFNKPIPSQFLLNLTGKIPMEFQNGLILLNINSQYNKLLNIQERYFNLPINKYINFALPIQVKGVLKNSNGEDIL